VFTGEQLDKAMQAQKTSAEVPRPTNWQDVSGDEGLPF
jgi:hypothetical protein